MVLWRSELLLKRDIDTVVKIVDDIKLLSLKEGFGGLYTFDWLSNAEALLSGSESGKVAVCVAELKEEVVGYCNLRPFSLGGWIDQTLLPRK